MCDSRKYPIPFNCVNKTLIGIQTSRPHRVFNSWSAIFSRKSFFFDQSLGFLCKFYRQKEHAQNDNCVTVFSTFYVQCCNKLKAKLQSNEGSLTWCFICLYNVIHLIVIDYIKFFPFFAIRCITDPVMATIGHVSLILFLDLLKSSKFLHSVQE